MRLKILASAAALIPALTLACTAQAGVQICDSSGKCVGGLNAPGDASSTAPAAPAAPTRPIVIADPAPPAPTVELAPAPARAPAPVAPSPPAPVVIAPPPAPVAQPVPAYSSQSVSVPTESGEVVVVTQASGPATSNLSSARLASGLPSKGMTRANVARQFGEPHTRRAPVGGGSPRQPPITRWDYAGFSVFFEYDHVVDAVERDNPAPIAVRDGLAGGPSRP